jgi:dihydroxy-acid dehydratase
MTREQIPGQFVAVVNTWNEMHPGHFHLNRLAVKVKEGVVIGGWVPFRFNTP